MNRSWNQTVFPRSGLIFQLPVAQREKIDLLHMPLSAHSQRAKTVHRKRTLILLELLDNEEKREKD